jgi:hypothetical protein
MKWLKIKKIKISAKYNQDRQGVMTFAFAWSFRLIYICVLKSADAVVDVFWDYLHPSRLSSKKL